MENTHRRPSGKRPKKRRFRGNQIMKVCSHTYVAERRDKNVCASSNKISGYQTSLKSNLVKKKLFCGSAGKMEVDGMLRIFNRSEKLHNLKYSNYIGDGDTKTFNALSENKPYGDDYLIQKIECVGHVQKRMGTRLRKLILVYSKKKLSDGKTIGGKGRLTDSLIDKLAHYYGNAIRCNSTSVKEMRKAIWAVFGVILAALMMNRCTGFVLQIQIHGPQLRAPCSRQYVLAPFHPNFVKEHPERSGGFPPLFFTNFSRELSARQIFRAPPCLFWDSKPSCCVSTPGLINHHFKCVSLLCVGGKSAQVTTEETLNCNLFPSLFT
ncbi:uncharacterized protein TNCV_2889911 [Trichonephila clavipes]|nr:uncharacterized protein TNCV_2889911 [Trichonephila clavipes]